MNLQSKQQRQTACALAILIGALFSAPGAHAEGFKVSGHINRAIMLGDNGTDSETFFVDNSASQSRLRVTGEKEVWDGLTGGVKFEVGYSSNPSNSVNFANRDISADWSERHIDLYLKGGFGKVSLGQGDGAANGGTEVDLSGTTLANYSGAGDFGGGIPFAGPGGAGPAIDDVIGNQDFESRHDRIRYDTPSFGNTKLSLSLGSKGGNDVTELAIRPELDLAGGKLEAAVGFSSEDKGGAAGDEQTFGGSVSWLGASGFNVTLAFSEKSDDNAGNPDSQFVYGKVGYKFGNHAVALDLGQASDFDAQGDDATALGIGYVFKAAKWVELYGSFHTFSLDRSGADFDDIQTIMAGARLKF